MMCILLAAGAAMVLVLFVVAAETCENAGRPNGQK